MNFIGRPRVSRVKVSELRKVKGRFGVGNYGRSVENGVQPIKDKRRWWMPHPPSVFDFKEGAGRTSRVPWVWDNVLQSVDKH